MFMNRSIWSRLAVRNKLPGYPCPNCANGKLKQIKDTLAVRESKYISDWRTEHPEDWESDHVTERWSVTLKCDEVACGEIANVIGDVDVVESSHRDVDGDIA